MTDGAGRADETSDALEVFLVAVEESGDHLGAALMRALRIRAGDRIRFAGVGGPEMAAEGLASLHSIDDFSIVGFTAIPQRLPKILRHLRDTLRAVKARRPDVLVIIDSPGYTLWVARFVHRADPTIPIVDYVSPSVWAWRPWRARSMKRYIAHVLALLPFEPEVHRKLGGPPCSYVGHPLVEVVEKLRPNAEEAARRRSDPPVLLVLPGSRSGEIERMAPIFGDAIGRLRDTIGAVDVVVPTVPHRLAHVRAAAATWPVQPRIVVDQADKQAAFRIARAALTKSGTVTLELALAGIPMVAAYRVSPIEAWVGRRMVRVPSYILANLVLGENIVPELIQEECTAAALAGALAPLVGDTPERRRQIDAFSRLDAIMEIGTRGAALRAADVVLSTIQPGRVPFAATAASL